MKKTSPTLKVLFVLTCIIIGFACITQCSAQSIVGKWKGVSEKRFYSEQGAKMMGKSIEERSSKEAGDSWGEYKSDHTFIIGFSAPNSSEVTIMKGTWSLMGDQLKLTLEPQYNPKKLITTATISINGNTLITTAVFPALSRVIKTISTSTRM